MIVNTWVVAYCKTEYKKRQHKIHVVPEKFPVFRFPLKNPALHVNRKRIGFVNRRDSALTRRSGICSEHFEEKFLKVGKRATLQWKLQPVTFIYSGNESIPPSFMPRPKTQRKPPSRVTSLADQFDDSNDHHKILDFPALVKSCVPEGTSCKLIKVEQCFANWKTARHSTFSQLPK